MSESDLLYHLLRNLIKKGALEAYGRQTDPYGHKSQADLP